MSAPVASQPPVCVGRRRRGRRAFVVAALTLCAALTPASGARAGTYAIDNCPSAPGGNGNAGPWTVFGAPQNTKGTCAGGLGNWIGPLGATMAAATIDGVQVGVPAGSGITIREAEIWWYVPHQISGADTFAMAAVNTGAVEEAGTPKDSSTSPDDYVLPSDTTELTLADYCSNDDASSPCVFGAGENPDLELLGAQLTLEDNSLPTGTVTGGALTKPGPLSGTAALTYDAQDTASGVRRVQLLLDGRPMAEHDYAAECPYQNFAACPTALSGELQWNTAGASNGVHEVSVRIVSAAGDSAILDEHTVTIENKPVQTSGGTITGRGTPNGEPCAGEVLELAVNGSPVNSSSQLPIIPYGKPVTVRGVLHCGTTPVRGARLDVTTDGGPASAAIDTTVQTGLAGSFEYHVPTGPDRAISFDYTAYSNDTAPSATATATISIRPVITLHIHPRRTRNRHTIHWTGAIAGGPYPHQGITLEVEVREGRRWKVFDQVIANSRGQFRYSYRFRATTEPVTYTFRVAMPDTGSRSYPYAPGASNTVRVHVAP